MASHEELVSQFTDVTGVESERARFYLESSAWQLGVRQHIYHISSKPYFNITFVKEYTYLSVFSLVL